MTQIRGNTHLRDPNLRAGTYPSARMLENMYRMIIGMRGEDGTKVEIRHSGIVVSSTSSSFAKYCFGFTTSGAVVTIKAGAVYWGTHDPVIMGDTSATITADYQYIGIEFSPFETTPSCGLLGPSAAMAIFKSDATHYRRWLYQFRLSNGAASLYRIGSLGNIELPGNFGG